MIGYLWILTALFIALLGAVLVWMRQLRKMRTRLRPWKPWAYALGLRVSVTPTGGVALKGTFERTPLILLCNGHPGSESVNIQFSIMSMVQHSFRLPEDLSPELQQSFARIHPYLDNISLTGATLNATLRIQYVRIDRLIDVLTQLAAMVHEVTDQRTPPDDPSVEPTSTTSYIQLAQFLERNLAMQHTGRPKGWELTGLNTFNGHHVSFRMEIQSIDKFGTLRGPLKHSVYTLIVNGFPVHSKGCPALGEPFQGIGTITHLNVVARTAELQWRAPSGDYT